MLSVLFWSFDLIIVAATLHVPRANIREIAVDASDIVGQLKNFQGTNNADTSLNPPGDLDNIHDKSPTIADLWPEYAIKHVLIYTFPSPFLGLGQNGTAGDPLNNENYNWTVTDDYIRFVTSRGAVASIQFHVSGTGNDLVGTPEIIGEVGYMITDRYNNGAYNSGFKDTIELFDFNAESDLENVPTAESDYETAFEYFAAFAKGVAKASSKAGVGAWASNRILPPHTNYTVYDPYISKFYADCAVQNVPIKAATYHFTNAQYSFDPYAIKTITDRFRQEILIPAGLPDLEIWVTESEPNPGGVLPTSPSALASYNDPAFFASYTLGTSMYAQDTSLTQVMPWTGFGYGGYGAGNAYFQPWFNLTSNDETVPLNVAAAWKLQASLVTNTSQRLNLGGASSDGFAALAGKSENGRIVQVLLNNYQLNYDIIREIAAESAPYINTSTAAYPLTQENGLLNGEQACFNIGNTLFFIPICQTFLKANIRHNHSDAYRIVLKNLPWTDRDSYTLQIQRVGGGQVYQVYKNLKGIGNSVDITVPFPANAQDLVTITRE